MGIVRERGQGKSVTDPRVNEDRALHLIAAERQRCTVSSSGPWVLLGWLDGRNKAHVFNERMIHMNNRIAAFLTFAFTMLVACVAFANDGKVPQS